MAHFGPGAGQSKHRRLPGFFRSFRKSSSRSACSAMAPPGPLAPHRLAADPAPPRAGAVPFEEDDKDASIWFLDHTYHENMLGMFRKINAKERVVGWYSTGQRIRDSDLAITALLETYCARPVLVVVDVQPKVEVLPTKAYFAVDEVKESGTEAARKVFQHLACEIGAYEAEEIGVEHLLRDVKDSTVGMLAAGVASKVQSVRGLKQRLGHIERYLDLVLAKELPPNNEVLGLLQEIFNLLPNLDLGQTVKSFSVKTNDMMMTMYVAMLMRTVLALHGLIVNKEKRLHAIRHQHKPAEGPAVPAA